MTPEEAQDLVANWSKGKEHFDTVRNLMAFLAHAKLMGAAHGRPTATGFVKGPNARDWDLEALYQAAVHAHPATRRKRPSIAVRRQKHDLRPPAQPELRPCRARQSVKLGPLFVRQNNRSRFLDACHASLNHDSSISDSGY